jgi:hypothetical protein
MLQSCCLGGITTAGAPPTQYDWQNLEAAAAAVASGARRHGEPAQPGLPVSSFQGQTSHSWTGLQEGEGVVREPPGSISSQGQIPHSWAWQQGAEGVVREPVLIPGSNSSQGQIPQHAWQQGTVGIVREPIPLPGSISSKGQIPNSWPWQQGAERVVREPLSPSGSNSSQGEKTHWAWQQGAEGVVREPVPPPGFISSQERPIPNSWACQQGAEEVVEEPVSPPGSISSQGQIFQWTWQHGAEEFVKGPIPPPGSISFEEKIPQWACQQGSEEVGRGSTPPLVGVSDDGSIPFVPGKVIAEEDISPSPHEHKRAEAETSGLLTNKPQDTCAVSGAEDPLGLVAALRERLQQMTADLERVKAAADRLHERLDGPDASLADRIHERLDGPDAPLADRLHERLDGPDSPLADRPHERLDAPDAPLADRLHERLDDPDAPLADRLHERLDDSDAPLAYSPSPSPSQPDGAAVSCSKTSMRVDTTEVFSPLKNRLSDVSDSPYPCLNKLPGALEPSTTEALPKSMEVEQQSERKVKATSVSRDFIPTASAGLSNLIGQQSIKRSPRCVPVWLKKEPVCVSVHNGQY